MSSSSRFDMKEHEIRVVVGTRFPSFDYRGHTWSPFDQTWAVTVYHRGTGSILRVHLKEGLKGNYESFWEDQEAYGKCVQHGREVALKERMVKVFNDWKGDIYKVIKIYQHDGEKPLEFRMGPGPCGRTVRGLKVEEDSVDIKVHQFCTDEVKPDTFVFPKANFKRWTFYRTENPTPARKDDPDVGR